MVRQKKGITKKGDEYRIVGGKSYVKEDGCYRITLLRFNGVREHWCVPSEKLTIEDLIRRLEGTYGKGSSGRRFLKKYGKPRVPRRFRAVRERG